MVQFEVVLHLKHMKHDLNIEMSRNQGQSSFKVICSKLSNCPEEILEPLLELAIEIAREGREGRRIGTLFTIGDAEAVMAWSRPLLLNPFEGHLSKRRHIASTDLWGTVKELAQLDGAFVVSTRSFSSCGTILGCQCFGCESAFRTRQSSYRSSFHFICYKRNSDRGVGKFDSSSIPAWRSDG